MVHSSGVLLMHIHEYSGETAFSSVVGRTACCPHVRRDVSSICCHMLVLDTRFGPGKYPYAWVYISLYGS